MTTAKKGISYTNHTDAAVTPPDHLMAMGTAVDRLSRSGVVVGPAERISTMQALKAVTINAARQYFEEASKGSIAVGKRAYLVVLDRNPLTVEPMAIRKIKVVHTIKDGRVIYSAQSVARGMQAWPLGWYGQPAEGRPCEDGALSVGATRRCPVRHVDRTHVRRSALSRLPVHPASGNCRIGTERSDQLHY